MEQGVLRENWTLGLSLTIGFDVLKVVVERSGTPGFKRSGLPDGAASTGELIFITFSHSRLFCCCIFALFALQTLTRLVYRLVSPWQKEVIKRQELFLQD
jgi:hypothetical protein